MKRSRSLSPIAAIPAPRPSPHKAKKLKLHTSYVVESPFPSFEHPTTLEATQVHEILTKAHPGRGAVRKPPNISSNSAQTCGSVPNVVEALVGVVLSQNTSGRNSSAAKTSLDVTFGRNNFAAIAEAPRADVVEAIRHGGLANKKAATIQNLLASIKEKHGDYSLQHLAVTDVEKRLSDDAIMQELISYDGVGPKTASCVLLFCLGRDSFAVDTHVFRLSKVLGWVPAKTDRVLAQAHLDLRIPGELKYGLHVLMMQHGRTCKGCKKAESRESCVLKAYVTEQEAQAQAGGGPTRLD
ncbi:DNA glycosylase [Lyophyllum atratum]|nr:DNA glycosylase [Lyophyllum atratum]